MTAPRTWPLVLRLGTAQTLAWGSTYYLPALLAKPMADGLGLPISQIWIAFTVALLASAVLGPFAGRAIDRWGGRPVLMGTSVLFALGLASLSQVQGTTSLMLAWLLIGMAMGSGLYEAAFAALVRLQGTQARASITGITLIAGFASTVGWPLTGLLESAFGWRGACLAWAGLHLLVGLPLNASIPRATASPEPPQPQDLAASDAAAVPVAPPHRFTAWALAYVFAATWFISTAMAAHLPQLLVASGATLAGAVAIGALVGPAQVAGRMLEFGFLRRLHPLLSARCAALAHPVGVVCWMVFGPVAGPAFALLHGAGNGILTIAKGTLPLVYFGPVGYGQRQGIMMAPSRVAQAFAPLLFGLCIERWGSGALWISGALGLSALAALLWLRTSGPKPPH
ncbi:MFS transporter [Hydrogenophaga sp.]|uniref:MFS transporter n=1 Tax=Hydrogenophaga sp. TaxID=1904254 RepID=UPI002731E852|nr:MFS transporter [Hydrogenophaga sp.]MDP2018073.1 MFS transporter [Hydrogenophaga sp.]MDP3165525.1 MFS transporter [Hydrogenophaga sp.]MDP3812675.1 MFS transporter [Hydrogenophaga sp.]